MQIQSYVSVLDLWEREVLKPKLLIRWLVGSGFHGFNLREWTLVPLSHFLLERVNEIRRRLYLIAAYWCSRETNFIQDKFIKRDFAPLKSSSITKMQLFTVNCNFPVVCLIPLSYNIPRILSRYLYLCTIYCLSLYLTTNPLPPLIFTFVSPR